MKINIAVILSAGFLAVSAWAAPLEDVYQQGYALAKAKDFTSAAPLLRQAAEAGHPGAQAAMGELSSFGDGVPQSKSEARKWYEMAAAQGHALALYNIGLYWDKGIGGPQDRKRALDYYRRGAQAGDVKSAYNAGHILIMGDGVAPNPVEGARLIEMAAADGNAVAHSSLGYIYENGVGVRRDARRALDHYAKAEKAGNGIAGQRGQQLASTILEEGLALERDRRGRGALASLDLACKYGQFYACYNAGRIYMAGELVSKNLNAALVNFRAACKWDNAPGCTGLANAVIGGAAATSDDISRTRTLAQTLCVKGDVKGCHNLAVMKTQPRYSMMDQQGAMKIFAQNCMNRGFQPSCQPYFDMYNSSLPTTSSSGSSGDGMSWLEQGIIDVLGVAAGTMSAMGAAGQYSSGSYSGYSSYSPPSASYSSSNSGYSPQDRADYNQFISSVSAYGQNIKCRPGNPYC